MMKAARCIYGRGYIRLNEGRGVVEVRKLKCEVFVGKWDLSRIVLLGVRQI